VNAPSLFDAASEALSIRDALPLSQASLRVKGLDAAPSGPLLVVHAFRIDTTLCGLRGGTATTLARAVTCDACRKEIDR
jgi:hypothetical protein